LHCHVLAGPRTGQHVAVCDLPGAAGGRDFGCLCLSFVARSGLVRCLEFSFDLGNRLNPLFVNSCAQRFAS